MKIPCKFQEINTPNTRKILWCETCGALVNSSSLKNGFPIDPTMRFPKIVSDNRECYDLLRSRVG